MRKISENSFQTQRLAGAAPAEVGIIVKHLGVSSSGKKKRRTNQLVVFFREFRQLTRQGGNAFFPWQNEADIQEFLHKSSKRFDGAEIIGFGVIARAGMLFCMTIISSEIDIAVNDPNRALEILVCLIIGKTKKDPFLARLRHGLTDNRDLYPPVCQTFLQGFRAFSQKSGD